MSIRFVYTTPVDPLALPLIEGLSQEYEARYGDLHRAANEPPEMSKYPPEVFAPPHGNFLLLLLHGTAVGGGAFKRYDEQTAEFKRVWTHADHRRQGIARTVLQELEAQAVRQGYRRIYLTTGFLQPEAQALYRNNGYQALAPGLDNATKAVRSLPFEKWLLPSPQSSSAPASLAFGTTV